MASSSVVSALEEELSILGPDEKYVTSRVPVFVRIPYSVCGGFDVDVDVDSIRCFMVLDILVVMILYYCSSRPTMTVLSYLWIVVSLFFLLLFLAIVIAGCSSFRMQSIKSIHPIGINPLQRDAKYQGQEGRYDRRRRASSVQQSIICIMVGGSNEGCTAGIGGTDKDDGTSSWNIDGKYYQCAPHRPLSDRKKSINAHDAYPYTTPSLCGTSCPCDTHTFPSLSILTI